MPGDQPLMVLSDSTRIIDYESMELVDGSKLWAWNGSLYLVDANFSGLVRFDRDGRFLNTVGNGRGDGPGELRQLFDVTFSAELVFLYDPNAHRIVDFLPDGTLLRSRTVDDLGLQHVALDTDVVLTTLMKRQLFTFVDTTGAEIQSMEHPVQDVTKNQLGLAGRLAPISDTRWLYSPDVLPFWSVVDRYEGVILTVDTDDGRTMDHVLNAPETNGNAIRFPASDIRAGSAWVQSGKVFLRLEDRSDPDARRAWLDIYALDDGTYLGQVPIPYGYAALDGQDLFISSETGVDRWRLSAVE